MTRARCGRERAFFPSLWRLDPVVVCVCVPRSFAAFWGMRGGPSVAAFSFVYFKELAARLPRKQPIKCVRRDSWGGIVNSY